MTKRVNALLKRTPPALALFIAAPVFGELSSGSAPLNKFVNPVTFLVLALLYGCGAVIAREWVIRWDKGWIAKFVSARHHTRRVNAPNPITRRKSGVHA